MKCPKCGNEMERGYLYVRGFGGSLYWGPGKDTSFFSRRGLQQIDLSKMSVVSPEHKQCLRPASAASAGPYTSGLFNDRHSPADKSTGSTMGEQVQLMAPQLRHVLI